MSYLFDIEHCFGEIFCICLFFVQSDNVFYLYYIIRIIHTHNIYSSLFLNYISRKYGIVVYVERILYNNSEYMSIFSIQYLSLIKYLYGAI